MIKIWIIFGLSTLVLLISRDMTLATPIYGPAPSNAAGNGAVPGSNLEPSQTPNEAVPSLNGPGFNAPVSGNGPQGGNQPSGLQSPSSPSGIMGSGQSGGANSAPGGNGANGQPTSNAPTFMNNAMPNSTNPFLPTNISPGLLSAPLENAYLQNGVPQLAAPLMSVVYRPVGLTYFQPNPFQVTPAGSVSVTGMYGLMSNINYQPDQTFTDWGSYYMIMPAITYSNFDDYGYISLLGSLSYYQYNGGNVSSFLNEMTGFSAGTYLGDRIFVGVQEFGMAGETPQMNGSPFSFFHNIQPYYENMADAEVGIALTPKITFVQAASDIYFDDAAFGAGFMNLQSLTDSLNFNIDRVDFLSLSYNYQQGFFSDFPDFISDGISATAMRSLTPTTSVGIGGSGSYFLMGQNNISSFSSGIGVSPNSYDFLMYSAYGMLTHKLNRNLSASLQGGWNVIQYYNGQSYPGPLVDLNIAYTDSRMGLAINAGAYEMTMPSYGVEVGPTYTESILGVFYYDISPKTSFISSVGYTLFSFLNPYAYSNNYFQSLQSNQSYNGSYLYQSDGITYTPISWISTNLMYTYMEFSTNIPQESIGQNMIFASVTFSWNFK